MTPGPTPPAPSPVGALLIVDDDDLSRALLRRFLTPHGFEVTDAADGAAALAQLARRRFDLVLLDVEMPGQSGLEVLAVLHARWPSLPVIMMSGQPGRNTVANALEGGACDFILKPFDDEFVLKAVKHALNLTD